MVRCLVLLAAVTACTQSEPEPTGEAVFRTPVADGNTFACATCHAVDEPADDGLRRPGHAVADATMRPHYKNGTVSSLRDAVNSCLTEWMAAAPWDENDSRWRSLQQWLGTLPPPVPAPPVAIQIVEPPTALDGGNAEAGREVFNKTCIVCHGVDGGGTERGPQVTGYGHARDFVARRIRTSGDADSATYPGLTGGRMPFWAADRLTDTEVLDLAAYVEGSEAPDPEPTGGTGSGGTTRTCDSTHAMVGHTATLSQRAHGVRGTARIVDDCTIDIEDFSYDGGGIDVRVYGATGGDYDNGFAISQNILGTPYSNGTLRVQLPVGKTLDDVDGVSVWCVAASFSFGDGLFGP